MITNNEIAQRLKEHISELYAIEDDIPTSRCADMQKRIDTIVKLIAELEKKMIFELSALMLMLVNATPQMQVWIVDAYVENHVTYVYYYSPQYLDTSTGYKYGDCTDKAHLTCIILNERNISCSVVHGWALTSKGSYAKHDYYTYWINNKQQFSCVYPYCTWQGEGIW